MKSVIVGAIAVLMFFSAPSFAAERTYRCEGVAEMEKIFGEIVFLLKHDKDLNYTFSLDFGAGAVVVKDAKCEQENGLPGLLIFTCTDEQGIDLRVTFDQAPLRLQALFEAPGLADTIAIDADCTF